MSNLRSLERSRNGITIAWDPADSPNCGPVLYYNVTIVNVMNTTQLSETRVEFSNLISGILYTFNVAAVNKAGIGPTSTIIVTTLTDDEGKPILSTYVNTYVQYVCTYVVKFCMGVASCVY